MKDVEDQPNFNIRHPAADICLEPSRSTAWQPYCLTVTGAVSSVFSHAIFSTPPPAGFLSTLIVSCSTGAAVAFFLSGMRARSCFWSYSVPHWPVCLFTISCQALSPGSVYSV